MDAGGGNGVAGGSSASPSAWAALLPARKSRRVDLVGSAMHLHYIGPQTRSFVMLFRTLVIATIVLAPALVNAADPPARKTAVSIVGDAFHIDGRPTYAGRTWQGHKIEGLLLNSRVVQGIYDDLNPETVGQWAYPDTGKWDADRNTREFIAAMPQWRKHGLLAFTMCLQGGNPRGYGQNQPWHNSAIESDGRLRADYMSRLERILNQADELGMVAILGIFY